MTVSVSNHDCAHRTHICMTFERSSQTHRLLAINYIHSHDIVHRDLKLENFLYDATDSNHLKLIDALCK